MNKKETLLIGREENREIYVSFWVSNSKGFLTHPKTVGFHVSFTLVLKSLQESGIKLSAVHPIHAGRGPPGTAVRK